MQGSRRKKVNCRVSSRAFAFTLICRSVKQTMALIVLQVLPAAIIAVNFFVAATDDKMVFCLSGWSCLLE